jgi:hypothetical protein
MFFLGEVRLERAHLPGEILDFFMAEIHVSHKYLPLRTGYICA